MAEWRNGINSSYCCKINMLQTLTDAEKQKLIQFLTIVMQLMQLIQQRIIMFGKIFKNI